MPQRTTGPQGVALLLLAMALTACDSARPPAPENKVEAPEEEVSNTAAAGENQADIGTSIIRPEVSAVIEPEPVKPETLTLAFGFNGNQLDDAAKAALDRLLTTPAVASGGAITVRGHTDSRGFDDDNLRVSQKRAEAVRDYLVEKGMAPERITAIGLGETRPIAPNANLDGSDNPEGRGQNRRVEIEAAVGEASTEPAAPADTSG